MLGAAGMVGEAVVDVPYGEPVAAEVDGAVGGVRLAAAVGVAVAKFGAVDGVDGAAGAL